MEIVAIKRPTVSPCKHIFKGDEAKITLVHASRYPLVGELVERKREISALYTDFRLNPWWGARYIEVGWRHIDVASASGQLLHYHCLQLASALFPGSFPKMKGVAFSKKFKRCAIVWKQWRRAAMFHRSWIE